MFPSLESFSERERDKHLIPVPRLEWLSFLAKTIPHPRLNPLQNEKSGGRKQLVPSEEQVSIWFNLAT